MRILGTSARRAACAAVLTPALLLGFTACGSDDAGATGSTKDSAGSDTGTTDSGKDSGSGDATGKDVDPEEFFSKVFKTLEDGSSASISMDMAGAKGDGVMSFASDGTVSMDLEMETGGQKMRMIMVDGTYYMSTPDLPNGMFLSIEPDDMGMGALTDEISGVSPKEQLDRVKEAVTKVTKVGEEKVDGETLSRYKLEIDVAKAGELAGIDAEDAASAAGASYELWVDKDFYQRRFVVETGGQTMDMSYDDWNKPVSIKAPAKDKVMSFSDLMGSSD